MRPVPNSAFYQDFLQLEEQADPEGTIWVITDNLSSHDSKCTRAWLEDHPRIPHAFIPKRACWLNMQEGWWRIFRRQALAGQDFADPDEIAHATPVATAQLNARGPALDLGTTRAQTPFLPPTLYIYPLRNVALATLHFETASGVRAQTALRRRTRNHRRASRRSDGRPAGIPSPLRRDWRP